VFHQMLWTSRFSSGIRMSGATLVFGHNTHPPHAFSLPSLILPLNGPFTQFITVEDVSGVRLWHLTPRVLTVLRALTGTMKGHYVERWNAGVYSQHKIYLVPGKIYLVPGIFYVRVPFLCFRHSWDRGRYKRDTYVYLFVRAAVLGDQGR